MENGVDWHGAICVMAIALGCLSGGVGLFGLAASLEHQRAEQPNAQYAAVATAPVQHVAHGLVLAHAGALITCGALALRARTRYSAHLRMAFRVGIPLVMLRATWVLSEQWALRGLPASGRGNNVASLLIAFGVLWSLGWSALKVGLFVWAARYLNRDSEIQAG